MNDRQSMINEATLLEPKRGDYWHEMLSPIALVLTTITLQGGEKFVLYLSNLDIIHSDDGWMWNTAYPRICHIDYFRERMKHEYVLLNRMTDFIDEVEELYGNLEQLAHVLIAHEAKKYLKFNAPN